MTRVHTDRNTPDATEMAGTVELVLEAQDEKKGNTEEGALAQMSPGPQRKMSL